MVYSKRIVNRKVAVKEIISLEYACLRGLLVTCIYV
jgi:hypothetical protein